METVIEVSEDLVVEVWPCGGRGDAPMIRLRSRDLESDCSNMPGAVVIWPGEVRHLVAALCTAAGLLAEAAASTARGDTQGGDPDAYAGALVTIRALVDW